MKYILENTLTNLYGENTKKSYLIEGSKVVYNANHFSKYKHMRLNTNQFVLTPGYIMIDFSVLSISRFDRFKERMKHLHNIGCTTIITACDVSSESQFHHQLKKAKHALINSSIDYLVGVKIPLTKLTPTIIRKCSKHKVPIIFTEINDPDDIHSICWQWIRNEIFPYQLMIVPLWNIPDLTTWKSRRLKSEWEELLTTNKITTQVEVPNEHTPLTKQFLLNVGLYPTKGSLQVGTDADYLFFSKQELSEKNNDFSELLPKVVFTHGTVKKAAANVYLQPGCGKELIVSVPRKFNPISNAFGTEPIYIDYY